MQVSRPVLWLSASVAALAVVAAGTGLLLQDAAGGASVVTVHGSTADLYGRGVYFRDSLFTGAAFRGTDAVTLLLALPLLAAAAGMYHRGTLAGALLLSGALSYFLYVYASMSLTATFNSFFLLYVVLFGASLWALVLLLASLLRHPVRLLRPLPHRGIGVFLLLAGALTTLVWLEAPLASLASGKPPKLIGAYTTLVTHALDLAVIVPAVILAARMLLRGELRGYVVAFPLLFLLASLLPMIVMQTVFQLRAGVTFTTPELVGPIGGFLVFGGGAAWVCLRVVRSLALRDAAPDSQRSRRAVGPAHARR